MEHGNTQKNTNTGRHFPGPVRAVEHALTRFHNFLYRVSKGKLGGTFLKAPVCLLTTTGRKTGKQRTVPLLYLADGDGVVLVASHGGDYRDPAWAVNLRSNPRAEVEIDGNTKRMTAVFVDDDERQKLWPRLVNMYGSYESYQKATSRRIPVIRLQPI